LSPLFLISIPPNANFFTQVCMHAIILSILNYLIIKFGFRLNVSTTDIIVPSVLFVILTPGVFATIPNSPLSAIGVHSLVFALVWALLRGQFSRYA
jgi:uncharacterized membrane protein (DUF441 family)